MAVCDYNPSAGAAERGRSQEHADQPDCLAKSVSFKISERLCPKGIMWKGMEQDALCLPLASMHMQECTTTHVDAHVNTTHTQMDTFLNCTIEICSNR